MWIIYSLACGIVLALIVFFALSIRKSRGANSNYNEYELNEYNNPYTWKDKGNYD